MGSKQSSVVSGRSATVETPRLEAADPADCRCATDGAGSEHCHVVHGTQALREAHMLEVEERQEVDVRKELARQSRFVRATGRRSWNARPQSEGDADIHVQSTDDWLLLTGDSHD